MPHVITNTDGPQIVTPVFVYPMRIVSDPEKQAKGQLEVELNNQHPLRGLWDTGATSTCISKNIAKQQQLKPNGKRRQNHAAGQRDVNTYLVAIGLVNGIFDIRQEITRGKMNVVPNIEVSEFESSITNIDVLIGMDIISRGSFKIEAGFYFSFWF